VPDSQPLRRILLVLQRSPEQEAALQALLDEQQDKSSANFHTWLTPEQFGKQFGPADADIQTLTPVAQSKGIHGYQGGRRANCDRIFRQRRQCPQRIPHPDSPLSGQWRRAPGKLQRSADSGGSQTGRCWDRQPARFPQKAAVPVGRHVQAVEGPQAGQQAGPEYTFNCVDFLTSIFGAFPGQSASCYPLGPYDFATIYNVLPYGTRPRQSTVRANDRNCGAYKHRLAGRERFSNSFRHACKYPTGHSGRARSGSCPR